MPEYRIRRSGQVEHFTHEDFRFIDERQMKVLLLRAEPNPTNMEQVGQEIGGVTRERARQIQNAALRKIREGRKAERETVESTRPRYRPRSRARQ